MAVRTLGILAHAIRETLKISVPAVWDAQRGTLSRQLCDERLRSWSKNLLDKAQLELVVSGLEHLGQVEPPFVIVCNHQSLYDIPVLFQALPLSITMAAKKELFSVPIWGKAMEVAGFVRIDRKNSDRAYEALQAAGQRMSNEKLSLVIAPEGTRSPTGRLLPFKNGAFHISKVTGHSILPVALDGTIRVHRTGENVVHLGQEVRVRIGAPLHPTDYPTVEEYRDTARASIEASLASIS